MGQADLSDSPRPVWIIERQVASGALRIGVAGWRYAAELNGRRLTLASNDIAGLHDIAASRHTARLVPALRDGGYTHLLGGQVGLLPGEAAMLKSVAQATPEGLALHRAKLVEALASDTPVHTDQETSGLAQHGDETAPAVSPARQALLDFDRRHPNVRRQEPAP